MKKFLMSFVYAFKGIISSFKSERNMKIHITVMTLVILGGLYFKINTSEWVWCIICFAMVISSEIANTSVETVVNLVSPEKNYKAGLAKDLAAGSVLVAAIGALIIGLIIFLPKIFPFLT